MALAATAPSTRAENSITTAAASLSAISRHSTQKPAAVTLVTVHSVAVNADITALSVTKCSSSETSMTNSNAEAVDDAVWEMVRV